MLPSNAISLVPVYSPYQYPDSIDNELVESFEEGGIAIGDASQGRLVQVWRAYVTGGLTIKVEPYIAATPTTLLVTGSNITSVSLGFDSNMSPTICYIEAGVMKLRWFNTIGGFFQTDSYAGVDSGRCCTDDKRQSQEGVSDVIFAYTRANVLYWRQQRDRYTVEYTVGPAYGQVIDRLGMNQGLRLQFELVDA